MLRKIYLFGGGFFARNEKVYNFVFGKVLRKSIFNQNIFPTTEEYIESKYQNKKQDVKKLEKQL